MGDPGGAEGYVHGGWTMPYWSDELGAIKTAELAASNAMLLGRLTYEGFARAWPDRAGDRFADQMNTSRKYVVSSTLTTATWQNSTIVTGDLVTEVAKIKDEPGDDILVHGSATLVQALLRRQLVDELHLVVYPILLGEGKRLFADGTHTTLELASQQTTGNGVLLLSYRRA